MFERTFVAGWGDMDFNAHMRNTAYLDRAADTRMMFFAAHAFPMQEFVRARLGPVVMRDDLEYFKEVNLLDELRVTLELAGLSADGSRFHLRNRILLADGTLAARVSSLGGWLSLESRRLTAPPPALLAALSSLSRTETFAELTGSLREPSPPTEFGA